jgi:hypothetical protein
VNDDVDEGALRHGTTLSVESLLVKFALRCGGEWPTMCLSLSASLVLILPRSCVRL